MKTLCRLLIMASLVPATLPAQDDKTFANWIDHLHLTATGSVTSTNNLSRTSHEPSRKDAESCEFSLVSNTPRLLAPSLLLITSAEIKSQSVPDYELNNLFKAGINLALLKKFGLGPLAPVLQINASTSYKSARLADDRGWSSEAAVQLTKRVLPQLKFVAGLQWLEHNAKNATFDLHQFSFNLSANWDLNERWNLSGQVGRLTGDIVANASWPIWGQAIYGGFGPIAQNSYTSRPWRVTNAYGAGWVAYNVDADVDLWSLSLSFAITDHTALSLEKSAAFVVNGIGISYPTDAWSLRLSHRF